MKEETIKETITKVEQELQQAEEELRNWQDYDFRREDGSMRQDAMHEKHGRDAKQEVNSLKLKNEKR
ncbi:hypothetical protein I6E85_20330 [Pseudoalteromonas sp. NZS71]|uniref:hypothetical protein n=1 Tax=unclassified Pseudoalteromonas TaxID=194690 RepID=UPI000419BA3C|nr:MULTISPECIES: hypothetical protein [unclassified Pseudoalteromonas]MBH0063466.1 hypothetical protein [Pseudoalteromonas sp. NZS71]